ncbi:MAG: hypothetical protein ACI4AD_04620 [Roseburia sp.]
MEHDVGWKGFLSDEERYADVINGIVCGGKQVVKASDLQEVDTQSEFLHGPDLLRSVSSGMKRGRRNVKIRDMVRKAAFGMNFAIIGIENQEMIDYSMPLRNLSYDAGMYERQASKIRKEVRRNRAGLGRGEYLYGFRKTSRLYPVLTFILYSGIEPWDGPRALHELLDFTDIPEQLQVRVPDYRMNLIEIRELKDTSAFRTDVRQVFDFIRCSEDKEALKELVEKDEYYQNMEEDAFEVVVHYTNTTELMKAANYYRKDGRVNMCRAITEWIAEEREEGIEEKTRTIVTNMVKRGMADADIIALAECDQPFIDEIRSKMGRRK